MSKKEKERIVNSVEVFQEISDCNLYKNLYENEQLLHGIIKRHKLYFDNKNPAPFIFTYGGKTLTFHIPKDGFNPEFGSISKSLLNCFLTETQKQTKRCTVLDLGCGAGFYALVATSVGYENVLGIDASEGAIDIAKINCAENGLSDNNIEFRVSKNPKEPFGSLLESERFNYIIANMPFTNEKCGKQFRENSQYFNYIISPYVLFQLLAGTKHFLKKEGEMFMSFGKSGYTDALNCFCNYLNLEISTIVSIQEKDEKFMVLKITHKNN